MPQITLNVPEVECIACGVKDRAALAHVLTDSPILRLAIKSPIGWHEIRSTMSPSKKCFYICPKCYDEKGVDGTLVVTAEWS